MMEKSNLIPFLRNDLHILFVGLNPAKGSSRNKHYFSVNQAFWNQLYRSGLITKPVEKMAADEIVFGSTKINFNNWSYGITDLVIEIAESDSRKIMPTVEDCIRLEHAISENKPRIAVLLHGTVVKTFMRYFRQSIPPINSGCFGRPLKDCPTIFYSVAFPHGNNIPSREKIERYIKIKELLLGNSLSKPKEVP